MEQTLDERNPKKTDAAKEGKALAVAGGAEVASSVKKTAEGKMVVTWDDASFEDVYKKRVHSRPAPEEAHQRCDH